LSEARILTTSLGPTPAFMRPRY